MDVLPDSREALVESFHAVDNTEIKPRSMQIELIERRVKGIVPAPECSPNGKPLAPVP
jgi:hypothetical protein